MNFFKFIMERIGTPILAATTIAILMNKSFEVSHGAFISLGVLFIYLDHHFIHPDQKYNFVLTLMGKIGPPMFAATLVACLLGDRYEAIHTVIVSIGLALIFLNYKLDQRLQSALKNNR